MQCPSLPPAKSNAPEVETGTQLVFFRGAGRRHELRPRLGDSFPPKLASAAGSDKSFTAGFAGGEYHHPNAFTRNLAARGGRIEGAAMSVPRGLRALGGSAL